jgi:HK97 gp10 family phage protein
MQAVKFELNGVNELSAILKKFDYDIKKKGGRFALRKAANLVKKAVVDGARALDDPKTAEMISKNVAVRWSSRTHRRTGNLAFRVGILGGARNPNPRGYRKRGKHTLEELGELPGKGKANPGGDTWYWRLLEFGTVKSAARPFMRPALQNNIQAATNEFISQYKKKLNRLLATAKKGGR